MTEELDRKWIEQRFGIIWNMDAINIVSVLCFTMDTRWQSLTYIPILMSIVYYLIILFWNILLYTNTSICFKSITIKHWLDQTGGENSLLQTLQPAFAAPIASALVLLNCLTLFFPEVEGKLIIHAAWIYS